MALNETSPILDNLLVNSFVMDIERVPLFRYNVQSVNLPDVSLPEVRRNSPFQNIAEVGDHCEFGSVSFEFKVDEELQNYQLIYYWMVGLGFPERYEQFEQFLNGVYEKYGIKKVEDKTSRLFQFSDINLVILSNQNIPTHQIKFLDAFPNNLAGLNLNVTTTSTDPVTATASFNFTGMEIKSLKNGEEQ